MRDLRGGPVAALFCVGLLLPAGPVCAQDGKDDAGVEVKLSAARTTVYPDLPLTFTVTVRNTGTVTIPSLQRSELVGPEHLLVGPPRRMETKREGHWLEVVRAYSEGTFGPLHPGEEFSTEVLARLPAELESDSGALFAQWVGRGGRFNGLRSNEAQLSLSPGTRPMALVETGEGTLILELWPDKAPNHVANFVELARSGFYDGLTFHRSFPNFIIQTGSPDGSPRGGPGYRISAEINEEQEFSRGVVGLAHAKGRPDTGGSQWFICLRDLPDLKGQYTAFGKVVEGMDVADAISRRPVMDRGVPADPVVLENVSLGLPDDYEPQGVVKIVDEPETAATRPASGEGTDTRPSGAEKEGPDSRPGDKDGGR